MTTRSPRSAWILGGLFARRGRTMTRALTVVVGVVMAVSISGLFGLVHFLTQVGENGRQRDLGSYVEGGCVQGSYRFDPVGLQQYTKYLLAASCAAPPAPPGLEHFPEPGQVFLSPALIALRERDTRIATRFPRVDGTIGAGGLVSSNELSAVIGVRPVPGSLPVGVTTFDRFGSDADFLANYLRFSRATFLAIGLFFTLLPGGYLIAAGTRLNARTRQRQIDLLSVLGVGPLALRRALAVEALCTVGVGALAGVLLARPLLSRATPTFLGWTAFPGDLLPAVATMPVVLALLLGLTALAAYLGARSPYQQPPTRRALPVRGHQVTRGAGARWLVLSTGIAAAVVTRRWHDDAAWPIVLGGRLSTFLGLLLITPIVCAYVGYRLAESDNALTALAGARLRHPSGGLTRALAALTSGLFVLSAGATSVTALGADPAAVQRAYAADGMSVVEVRRPGAAVRERLQHQDLRDQLLAGTNNSDAIEISGTLHGSCPTVRATIGQQVPCGATPLFGITYQGQRLPDGLDARPVELTGPRAELLSGFLVTVDGSATLGQGDDDIFIPLATAAAARLYDELIGLDASVNVRIAGAADVSGASELETILDVFRWGAGFAVLVSLLACLISLVALLYDRRAGNNYVQVLGLTRRRTAIAALAEVMAATAATTGLALACSLLWALSLGETANLQGILRTAGPFLIVAGLLAVAAAAIVSAVLRQAPAGLVPDRDGLVSARDVFTSGPARTPSPAAVSGDTGQRADRVARPPR